MILKSHAITDIGMKRKINQDAFLKDDELRLYVVADGMGGHRGGEVASQLSVQVMQTFCKSNASFAPRELLDKAVNAACQAIYEQSTGNAELAGMGTTIVAMLFDAGVVSIAQVGDSRVYLMNQHGIWQITEDHSLVNEEIRAGRLMAGQAASYQFKNVITRSVGYESKVNVDIYRRAVQPGDIFLLCTDGLSGLVSMSEMHDAIIHKGLDSGLSSLISLANSRGGDDNITGLVTEVVKV
jgi:PPM family protein phosphatase